MNSVGNTGSSLLQCSMREGDFARLQAYIYCLEQEGECMEGE